MLNFREGIEECLGNKLPWDELEEVVYLIPQGTYHKLMRIRTVVHSLT